ncbi:hypothetical protein BCS42_08410 [Crenothrix sp. D3]|nr:hypothetical protein BCS42_08410 [Crenothrix sp. D3]
MNIQEINKLSDKIGMQHDMPNMATLLQLIKQHDYKFDKDEILEIHNRVFGRWGGIFFTPNKIAELISVIGRIYNPKTVIDICCGYGNLLSYFKHLQNVRGIEINADAIKLAKYINPDADLTNANTLEWNSNNDKYDLVVGNLPFGARTPERRPLEVELIKKGLTLLNDNGVAIFIVAAGVLFRSDKASSEFREEILSKFSLDIVISLPSGAFNPYTGIRTSILVIRNGKKNQDVFMPKFKNNSFEIANNFEHHKGSFYSLISEVKDRFDRGYYESKKLEIAINSHELYDLKKLSDIASILNGKPIKSEYKSNGKYLVFNQKDKENNNRFVNNIPDENLVLKSNDIVIGLVGENPKIYFHKDNRKAVVIKNDYAIIRPNSEHLSIYLETEEGRVLLKKEIMLQVENNIAGHIPRLTIYKLKNFLVPILSHQEIIEWLLNEKQKLINQVNILINKKEYDFAKEYIEEYFEDSSESSEHKFVYLKYIDNAEKLEETNKQLDEKNKELNNLIAMFAHNFLGTLQCIRSNAEHDNNPKIHLKTVKMMSGALTAFSIISADDDKLIEQLKQDNKGEINLQQNLANNLALAVSQLLSKTNKDKIINLYINYLCKTNQIEKNTTSAELSARENRDYRKKWQALQHQWEDEFNALFSENVELSSLQTWLADNFFPVQITGFNNCNIRFKEYGITDSIFLVVFMEILVNVLKYMDVSQNQPLILTLDKQDQHYHLICENPSSQETYRGTHKGMDFLKSIARKLNAQFITESNEQQFKTTFIIPAELLD